MSPAEPIEAIAALDEPARRRLYDYVAASGRAISRDEASGATGIGRPLAAFHLDRLAEQGLLSVEFRRLSGRTGRGAGRPSKLYRRADRSFAIQLPPRHYELAAELMAEAIDTLGAQGVEALERTARACGAQLGREFRTSDIPAADQAAAHDPASVGASGSARPAPPEPVSALLAQLGYEPHVDAAGEVRLANCPFRDVAAAHRQATCGMNLSIVQGVLDGLDAGGLAARLEPRPPACCVVIGPIDGGHEAVPDQIDGGGRPIA